MCRLLKEEGSGPDERFRSCFFTRCTSSFPCFFALFEITYLFKSLSKIHSYDCGTGLSIKYNDQNPFLRHVLVIQSVKSNCNRVDILICALAFRIFQNVGHDVFKCLRRWKVIDPNFACCIEIYTVLFGK